MKIDFRIFVTHVISYHCGGGTKPQELLEWQLRVRSEQSWAVGPERAGLRLAEMATYRASTKC